jgi:hypothetical protein
MGLTNPAGVQRPIYVPQRHGNGRGAALHRFFYDKAQLSELRVNHEDDMGLAAFVFGNDGHLTIYPYWTGGRSENRQGSRFWTRIEGGYYRRNRSNCGVKV